MTNKDYGLYAIALAIAVVGALWLGVSAGTLALLGLAVACPLMMMFMMRGMHRGDGHDQHAGHDRRHEATERGAPYERSTGR